jgi:hypothetical protein
VGKVEYLFDRDGVLPGRIMNDDGINLVRRVELGPEREGCNLLRRGLWGWGVKERVLWRPNLDWQLMEPDLIASRTMPAIGKDEYRPRDLLGAIAGAATIPRLNVVRSHT